MRRRDFLTLSGATVLGAAALPHGPLQAEPASPPGEGIAWQRHGQTGLVQQVIAGREPLVRGNGAGLLDGFCRPSNGSNGPPATLSAAKPAGQCGAVHLTLSHRLLASGGGAREDVLEASLTLHNPSDRPQTVDVGFRSAARPCERAVEQQIYVPLASGGLNRDPRFAELGSQQWPQDCRQPVGAKGLVCHYLEPLASDPHHAPAAAALLLVPVVDIFHAQQPWRVGLFTTSLEAACFRAMPAEGEGVWQMGHCVRLEPGQRRTIRGYLHVHRGDAAAAWAAFQRFGHREDFPPVPWLQEIRVHYYDFLSAAEPKGRRGNGYETDLPWFRKFHVGLATQHGYYPAMGDYLHPDRKEWLAMTTDRAGAATMSLEKMKARIQATRRAGAHPAVYMHLTCLDGGLPLFEQLKDSVVVDAAGNKGDYDWLGPDTIKHTWKMSLASAAWRDNLLQQARWIMELLDPDAIVMDETFSILGYDHHPERQGPYSLHGIDVIRKIRALVHSFGPNKAFLTSDCSMANTVMWSDGEVGDHAYSTLLGHPLYLQSPVRYLAALGRKPWRPCAWDFQRFWPRQMELARMVAAGVGVSNGWIQYTGLTRLTEKVRQQMIHDIESLIRPA